MLTSIRGLLAATILAGGLVASPAFADETDPPKDITISGYAMGVTDYRWRGLSYSGGDFAVQGQINVAHSSGFYAGLWGSSLEQDALDIYGSAELDVYAGWSGDVASGLTADVGMTWYTYPNGTAPGLPGNYFEPYASLSAGIGPVTAKVGVNYAWSQQSLGNDDNLYVYGEVGTSIPGVPVDLGAHLGYTSGALSPKLLTGVSTDGGFDYSVSATYNITDNLSVGASYIGVDGASIDGFSNDAVVGTVKLAF
ncbi:TorF family putative porin [Novosphingobium sp.]|uniref:TorF family putative porin n=1 Tax=Novosphingobium sp. TaxID=1874826 RepID=UPI0025CC5C37|nr:TorF family putative porin [Novosphingobium sp.]